MSPRTERPWLKSYAQGVPADIPAPTQTLVAMFEASARRYRRRTALDFFGQRTTYGELSDQVSRVANALRRLGVQRGDRVAIVLPNSPQHVVAFYATLRLGAIVVEHNPLYTERELRHQFEDHGATVAIVWDKVAATVLDFPADVRPKHVVAVDVTRGMPLRLRMALRLPFAKSRANRTALTTGRRSKGAVAWADLVASRPLPGRHPRPRLQDVAALQYTSGTTGSPKGAMLTHRNLRANASQG